MTLKGLYAYTRPARSGAFAHFAPIQFPPNRGSAAHPRTRMNTHPCGGACASCVQHSVLKGNEGTDSTGTLSGLERSSSARAKKQCGWPACPEIGGGWLRVLIGRFPQAGPPESNFRVARHPSRIVRIGYAGCLTVKCCPLREGKLTSARVVAPTFREGHLSFPIQQATYSA